ncbi:hypothetical protein BDK51DRAFT_21733, partial [Blyttiomyces helicus]
YAQQPAAFIQAWREMADAITATGAVRSQYALVWGPNVGNGVGYDGYYANPNNTVNMTQENFNSLDTNNDGHIGLDDNPYAPYYPGDDYVDWVGLSVSTEA